MPLESRHQYLKDWLENRYRGPRTPDSESDLLFAAKVFDSVWQTSNLPPEQLKTIVDAASHPRAIVWMNAVEMLGFLSEKWPCAANAILEMSKSKKAPVRFNAVCCLRAKTPVSVTDEVLTSGFMDKSSKVRWKAAQTANVLKKSNLISALAVAVNQERNVKARKEMEFSLLFLRDGYILKPRSDGRFDVTVRTDSGGCHGSLFSAEELRAKGIDAIVSELQQTH